MDTISFYSVYDVDMQVYAPPFLSRSDDEAKTMLRDAIEEGSVLHKFPAHYHLYRVGVFDSKEAITDFNPFCVCSVGDLVYRLPAVTGEEVAHE